MTTNKDLKARRVEAKINRKVAAEACGISMFRLDRIERGDVDDADAIKGYTEGLEKLIAAAKKQPATSTKPKAAAKKTTARKATQPKPKPKADETAA